MRLWYAGAAALVAALSPAARTQPQAPPPTATINFTAKAPKLDGRMDDPVWQQATPLPLKWTWDGLPVPNPAIARLAFDEKFIYLAFEAPDTALVAARTTRDSDIFGTDDLLDFLLWPQEESPYYYRMAVNPRGAALDVFYITDGTRTKPIVSLPAWNPNYDGRVKQGLGDLYKPGQNITPTANGSWCVEVALPLSAFSTVGARKPGNGDTWRVQFGRYDRPDGPDGKPAISCWSAYGTMGWPHNLDRFGTVTLAGAPARPAETAAARLPEAALLAEPPSGPPTAPPPAITQPPVTPAEPKPAEVTPPPPVTPVEPKPAEVTPPPPVTPVEPKPAQVTPPPPVTPAEPTPPPVTPAEPTPPPVTPADPTPPPVTPVEPTPPVRDEGNLSISISNAPLGDALRVLFRGTNYTYAMTPGLTAAQPRVTLNLEGVSWDSALARLVGTANVEYAKTGNTFTFSQKGAAPPAGDGGPPPGPIPG